SYLFLLPRGISTTTSNSMARSPRRRAEQQRVGPPVQPAGQVEVDELLLGVLVQGVRPELAAQPALLVPAERVGGVDHVPVVDPDRSGLDLAGYVEGPLVVGAPDPGGEPALGVVGGLDGSLGPLRADHREYRAEDLLARDRHVVADVAEDRRLDPE